MANEDAKEFLSLFKHKSAIDPRSITGAITLGDSDDDNDNDGNDGNEAVPFRLLETNKKPTRKRGASKPKQAPSIKRSKSEGITATAASEVDGATQTSSGAARGTRSSRRGAKKAHSEVLVLDDDEGDFATTSSSTPLSPSLLTPSLAAVLEKVNENKKLRAHLKNSVDSPSSTTDNTTTTTTPNNNNNHHTQSHRNSRRVASSSGNNASKTSKNIYSVDSDDEEPNKTTTTTTATPSSTSSSSTLPISNVLFLVYSAQNDTRPLKFRCLQNEGFEKLLQAYCKYKGFDSDHSGFKWYGIPLDPRKTPLSYEMTEEEQLYYYDKRSSSSGDSISGNKSENTGDNNINNNSSSELRSEDTVSNKNKNNIPSPTTTTTTTTTTTAGADEKVQNAVQGDAIILKLRDGDVIQKFRIKRTDPMKKLIDGFASKQHIDPKLITLFFDGLALLPTHTPDDHDMESDDIIEVKKTS